jgi:hypothetical protein
MQSFRCSHKLVVMVYCLLSAKGEGALDHGGGKLVGKKIQRIGRRRR